MGDMVRMEVEITKDRYEKLVEEAKEELRKELTDDAVKKYIQNQSHLDVVDVLSSLGLQKKVEALLDMKVKDLTLNQLRLIAIHTLVYN